MTSLKAKLQPGFLSDCRIAVATSAGHGKDEVEDEKVLCEARPIAFPAWVGVVYFDPDQVEEVAGTQNDPVVLEVD